MVISSCLCLGTAILSAVSLSLRERIEAILSLFFALAFQYLVLELDIVVLLFERLVFSLFLLQSLFKSFYLIAFV